MKGSKESVHKQSAKMQYIATFVVNMQLLVYGITSGWSSPSVKLLQSIDSPLPSGAITKDEGSWIASLFCLGGLLGNVIFGAITAKFGRKKPLLLLAIPTIIAWSLIWFADNVYYLYAARILLGCVGGGLYAIVPLTLSEIAIDRVRGILGSTLVLSGNIGILLALILGCYFDFYMMPKVAISITIFSTILLFFFPETPPFLVKMNKMTEAEASIRFYQNLKKDTDFKVLQSELTRLKNALEDGNRDESAKKSIKWSDISSGIGRKAMTIGIILALLNQLSGCFAMLQFTSKIFEDAGSSLKPNLAAIVVGVVQLVGSYIPTVLVERAGRKLLFVISTVGVALGLIVFGVYSQFKSLGYDVESLSFIPIASFSFVIFIASWAILTLPFLVISEIMPEKLKDFGLFVCNTIVWSCGFLMIKYLQLLIDIFEFHGTMYLFASFCLVTTVYIIIYLPETKGKSYEQIMRSLE